MNRQVPNADQQGSTKRTLQAFLLEVLDTYGQARSEPFKSNPWRKWFESSARATLGDFEASRGLKVRIGSGDGGWPEVPWVGLSRDSLAETPQRGIYVAILFKPSLDGCVLSLQQGITEMRSILGIRRSRPVLRRRATEIRERTSVPDRFATDSLGIGASERRGRMYEVAHICGRSYSRPTMVNEISDDLDAMIGYYDTLAADRVIVNLVNRVPNLEEEYPEIDVDARDLDDARFEKKYADLIADLAKEAREGESLFEGTPMVASITSRRVGQQALKKALLDLYQPTCFACGESVAVKALRGGRKQYSLHAAHIVSVAASGRTRIDNGILLCPNHHWAFDHYCWWVDDDGTIFVRDAFRHVSWLQPIHGRKLAIPTAEWARPSVDAIRDHRNRAQTKGATS